MPDVIPLDGPFYDDLVVGRRLARQPAVTLHSGVTALHQALVGERLALCLDIELCRAVTGSDRLLVSPGLVMQMSIGQSTTVSRRAVANLFYRNVRLPTPVFVGDTVETAVVVSALADSSPKPGRAHRGKVLVDIVTTANGEPVATYQRCPMLPAAGPDLPEHADDLGDFGPLDLESFVEIIPPEWKLGLLGESAPWSIGESILDPTRDVIDGATSLVRLTHNLAMIHRDASEAPYPERLVYGGHVVGLAQASLSRVVPNIATVLGWHECNHTGPAFEGDLLSFEHTLMDSVEAPSAELQAVRVQGFAHRDDSPVHGTPILDWTVVVLVAPRSPG